MKNFLLLIVFCISFTNASTQWQQIDLGISQNFHDLFSFPNSNTVFVCGEDGLIYVSYNSGLNWQTSSSNISQDLFSIAFRNSNYGWAVGSSGRIIKTENGGLSWTSQSSTGTKYNSVYSWAFTNPDKWAITVGDVLNGLNPVIKKTTDGGNSWNSINNNYNEDLNDVFFLDIPGKNGRGYAVGGGDNSIIIKSTNGGLSWEDISLLNSDNLNSVYFINLNTGFIVGDEGKFYKTSNGGTNWNISILSVRDLKSIFFPDSLNGWIVGSSGTVIKTTDGGSNWEHQQNIFGNHSDVRFSNTQTGWIASNLGVIYFTTNGGSVGIQNISSEIPQGYLLKQNYPNPFNPTTNIEFSLPVSGNVSLKVYDISGREVSALVNQKLSAGTYRYEFDGSALTSEIYFYSLETETFKETKKMVLMK